jgi:hypothetical protein
VGTYGMYPNNYYGLAIVLGDLRNPDLVLVLVLFFLFMRSLCGKKEKKEKKNQIGVSQITYYIII